MKKLMLMAIVVLTLFEPLRAADQPVIVGVISNRAGGEIVFTSNACPSDKTQMFVYIKEDGGRIKQSGCWTLRQKRIYVFWDDGEVFEYELDALQITPEYQEYLKRTYPQENQT